MKNIGLSTATTHMHMAPPPKKHPLPCTALHCPALCTSPHNQPQKFSHLLDLRSIGQIYPPPALKPEDFGAWHE
jgi:hypothetical protein